jgi:FixJ family two-component response regulator
MAIAQPVVAVIDDDESVRESLPDLLVALGFIARAFPSAASFLAAPGIAGTACLLVDVAMPHMSGPELQRELQRRGTHIPLIFITADRDESQRERLIEQGALDCLFKPFGESELLRALMRATGSSR